MANQYRRSGTENDPFVNIIESQKIINGIAQLTEIPVKRSRVVVSGYGIAWSEADNSDNLDVDSYYVNYDVGLVYFHISREGTTPTFSYYGCGYNVIPANRVWTKMVNGNITETLEDFLGDTSQVISDVANATQNANNATISAQEAAEAAQELVDTSVHRGEYDSGTQYSKNNEVRYDGSTWRALQDVQGITPEEGQYWTLVARRGVDGTGSVVSVNNIIPDIAGNVALTAEDVGAAETGHKHTGAAGDEPRIDFNDLDNIPVEFPPEAHQHDASDINSGVFSTARLPSASTSDPGIVQLNDSTSSTSTTQAATANAVKTVQDGVNAKFDESTGHTHDGTAGSGPKLDAENIVLDSEDFTADNVKEGLEEAKGVAIARVRSATIVVAASNSSQKSKDGADYVCDGIDDQDEINAAIQALPADGGEIVLMEGTFNISAKVNVNKNNVSIRGVGNASILKRMWNSTPSSEGVITLTEVEKCTISDLSIDGNKSNYLISYNQGIRLNSSQNNILTRIVSNNNSNHGINLNSSSNSNTITGNTCNNNSSGICIDSSENNTVTGNICDDNNSSGINLNSSGINTITGNTCNNNSNGIYLNSSSNSNTITGNTCNNNIFYGIYLLSSSNSNTITGNIFNNNVNHGIYLNSSDNNTLTGNICKNNSNGIYLSSSDSNTVTGNTCIRGTGDSSDYNSSQYTIYLVGSGNHYNLISSNNCMGKAVAIGGGTSNTEVNNKYE